MGARGPSFLLMFTAAAALVARAVAGCVDLDSLGNGVRTDAGGDAPVVSQTPDATPDPCERVVPVGKPAGDDPDAAVLAPFAVGIRTFVVDTGKVPGLDLDGVCTCDKRPGVSHDGGESCKHASTSTTRCDFDGGIDNALGDLAGLVEATSGGTRFDDFAERVIQNGQRTLLLQISDYNGQANDSAVYVSLFLASGLTETGCDASVGDAGFYLPGWCGTDKWRIAQSSLIGGTQRALVFAGDAYVRDYQLVATSFVPPVNVPFSDSTDLVVRGAIITGTLVPLGADMNELEAGAPPDAGGTRFWRLKGGMFAGRSSTRDLLRAVASLKVGLSPLCKQPDALKLAIGQICGNADVNVSGADNADEVCDGLSVAVGFTADPVVRGDVDDGGTVPDECDGGPVEVNCP